MAKWGSILRRLACLALCSHLAGVGAWALDERQKPKEPEVPKPAPPEIPPPEEEEKPDETKKLDENKVLVEALNGVRFVSKAEDVLKETDLKGVEIAGVDMLDHDDFREEIKEVLGEPITLKFIRDLARKAVLYYRAHDRPFVKISVPEQDITTGVVQYLVVESKIGKVTIEGDRFWRTKQYADAVNLKPGDEISEKQLIEDLNYFNENAFRSVKPVFKPGAEPNTTDLVLQAEERFPVRFYGGYEDTGTQTTGLDRWLVGFNWANGFMHEHEIGYQFSADIEARRLLSHSGYWRIPLPHRHKLQLSGGYSTIQAPINEDLNNTGFNFQLSLRYIAPLPRLGKYRHEAQLGFDFKQTDNNLEFGGQEVFSSLVDVLQAALQYNGNYPDDWGRTNFTLNAYYSPGHLSDLNTSRVYGQARAATDPQYAYSLLALERTWSLPKEITFVNRLKGQVSSARLQSTEQLLVGGFASVRGYDDRLIAGDEGFEVSTELRSPNFSLGLINGDPQYDNRIQFVAFWEFARTYNFANVFGERKHTDIESVGGGVRYRLGSHLSVHFDYGRQLRRIDGNVEGGDRGRIHLGVVVSY
ncbi:MAG: hypothetical protein M5U26_21495 [Planctomycetota bacterium]|nr:hypothetical protein [Planctomycetota bacterium]